MKSAMRITSYKYRKFMVVLLMLLTANLPNLALARDDASNQSIADAMNTSTAQSFNGVSFYFGDQPHAEPDHFFGTYTSRKTTNAFNKSDYEACQWAFLSAIKSFYERAVRSGANAVVNMKSVTTGQSVSSADEFVCRVGNVIAKVYITADVVTL